MSTPEFELSMDQGAYFATVVNWYGGGVFLGPIEEIETGYPTMVRVSGHQLPSSSPTPVIITGVQGAAILNSKESAIPMVKRVDDDYFTVPISTVPCEYIPGTGEITFNLPTDLTDYTGRCQMRTKWHAGEFITDWSTEPGDGAAGLMTLDANDGSVQIESLSAVTASLDFVKGFADMEVISPEGIVTRVARLIINFNREMTK